MEWIEVAERFGLPLVLLLGAVYGIVKLFNWMANDMMYQIKQNNVGTIHAKPLVQIYCDYSFAYIIHNYFDQHVCWIQINSTQSRIDWIF